MMRKGGDDDVTEIQGPFLSTEYRPRFSTSRHSTSRKLYHEFENTVGHCMMNRPRCPFVRPSDKFLMSLTLCYLHIRKLNYASFLTTQFFQSIDHWLLLQHRTSSILLDLTYFSMVLKNNLYKNNLQNRNPKCCYRCFRLTLNQG